MTFSIDSEIKSLCPNATLGILIYSVTVKKTSDSLLDKFNSTISELESKYVTEDIVKINHIHTTREAYKALGKSPSSYRNASEAMLRRIVKGKGLYNINNVVEINNIISVCSGYSIGSYNLSCVSENITLKRVPDGENYDGIGKSSVNIEHLPTLYDEEGPFGNPTSDSQRAMIKEGERKVASVIYSFDGSDDLEKWMAEFKSLLTEYTDAKDIDTFIVE